MRPAITSLVAKQSCRGFLSTSAMSRFVTRPSVLTAGSDSRRRGGRGDGYQDFLVEHVLARLERKSPSTATTLPEPPS